MSDLPVCTVDFETRSYLDVRDVGAWRYAEDKTTEIMCMNYKFGADPGGLWVPGMPFPQTILDHIEAGGTFEAHSAQFERAHWILILNRKMGIPIPTKWQDTQAVCAYRGLPLSLDDVGQENCLDLPVKKSKRGKYLIQALCMPKWGTKADPDRIYREDWDLTMEMYDYCIQDGDSEHALSDMVGVLPPQEYKLWVLDQRINMRGVKVDLDAVEIALGIIKDITTTLNGEIQEITGGVVTKATQRQRMLDWFRANGLNALPNMQKGTIEDLLAKNKQGGYVHDFDPKIIRALEIRQQLSKSSTKKLQRMKDSAGKDGRIRGMLQYHGAQTGRWAGRLVQPHNFPRATVTNKVSADGKKKWLDMDQLITDIRNNDFGAYKNPMEAMASSLRGMFISEHGKVFRVCDFAAIEARVTFWVAGCKKGLDVFAASDRGESEDIYCITASGLVGFEVKKALHSFERQLGKIVILGCGYQMGWATLQKQAVDDYDVVLDDDEAKKMVYFYRDEYKEVKWLWGNLNEAAITAVKTGHPYKTNGITYQTVTDNAGFWLTCKLPNGRKIWYFKPRIVNEPPSWGGAPIDKLYYMGRDNKKGGAWSEISTYGGMLCENVVQAIARDLMAEAMIRVEFKGYKIILTVHDEIISEDDIDFGSMKEFEKLMSISPPWAHDCPIAVEGGEITRYRKV